MDPGPEDQVSGACLRLAHRVGLKAPPSTSLRLTLDLGGVGGADTLLPLVSALPSSLRDPGQVLGLLGLRVLLVVSLSSQLDRYRPRVGNGLREVPGLAPGHTESAAGLGGPHSAVWKWSKQAWRSSRNQAGPEQPCPPPPGEAGLRG